MKFHIAPPPRRKFCVVSHGPYREAQIVGGAPTLGTQTKHMGDGNFIVAKNHNKGAA